LLGLNVAIVEGAAAATASQIEMAKQLSPQEQAKLAKQMGVKLPASTTSSMTQPLEIPEVIKNDTIATNNDSIATNNDSVMKKNETLSAIEYGVWFRLKQEISAIAKGVNDNKYKDLDNVTYVEKDQLEDPDKIWKSWLKEKQNNVEEKKPLRQFGYSLFAGSPTTFAPVTEIPVPSEYVMGPGDELKLQFYGQKNDSLSVMVDRSGLIEVPEIGSMSLMGLTYAGAKALLAEEVRKKSIGVTLSVSMGQLRSMRVFVLGDAKHPGSYMVSSLSTISNALFVSGGISKQGSMRNVQLKRKGKLVATLDLYDFLLHGDSSKDYRLLAGDVIFIAPVGKTVAVSGEVNRPAIYEIKKEKTVSNVVGLAGGLTATADRKHEQLDRISDQGDRLLLDLRPSATTKVQSGDIIIIHSVPGIKEKQIELLGEVKRPGKYEFYEGMRLHQILSSASDLLATAHTGLVLIKREKANEAKVGVIRLSLAELFKKKSKKWPLLQDGDKIYVFSQRSLNPLDKVSVSGEVMKPGVYPLGGDMNILNLVLAAGGPTDKAYLKEVEITRYTVEDGKKRVSKRMSINLAKVLVEKNGGNIALQAYDEVLVRKISQWSDRARVKIKGEVVFPSEYTVENGEKLSSLLKRAGGFTAKAYLPGAVFMRESIREEQQQKIDESTARLKTEIAQLEGSIATLSDPQVMKHKQNGLEAAKRVLVQMEKTEAIGRLVIELQDIEALEKSEFDITLIDGDTLIVPKKPEQVLVLGQVYNTVALLYRKKYKLDDYIEIAGGMTRMADKGRTYVVRASGLVERVKYWGGTSIYPGDAIVVPEELEQFNLLDSTLDWSRALMQIGVGAASLKTIGVF